MLVVIYKAHEGADLDRVLVLLNGEGLHPVVLDDANPDGALLYASANTARIRVAVPEHQVERAAELLRADAAASSRSTRRLARRVERGVLQLVLGAAAIIGLVHLGQWLAPDVSWATIGWIAGGLSLVLMLIGAQRGRSSPEE